METKKTNKEVLVKGLKIMGMSLGGMFLGPLLIHVAFSNQEKPLYIPILVVSIIICGLAVYLAFKGLRTILDSMFKK
ncbi:DUF6095 family protein [Flavivirga sp. 57AJ16]|uniref:DUF6095 family protein n=1 Tax=Flavivirga sp. 57AJ16 TaxID=3025307 RepID=UPI002366B359|nr:DUF6095 family protein [Flavivirga sp. 57AJ16]MDD7887447.1 DUF6095 family protein [Flavivirga sp. 57AJ16]